ncbi:MAG: laccase domain-containing protein [Bacteroidales bacterium]|nr:laccase domain-containing protein [Bacteroidales bacterium]
MTGNHLFEYSLGEGVEAFTAHRDSLLPYPVVQGHQVHGSRIALIDRPGLTREALEGYDAFITKLREVAIGVRTADCVPVLLYDPRQRVVAAVHAGWRGTVQRISQKTLQRMAGLFGCRPGDVRAVVCPAIGPDSFQVGPEVTEAFRQAGFPMDIVWSFRGQGNGRPMSGGEHIDLFSANRWLLEQSGLQPENIQVCAVDTYTETRFYSARREGLCCGRNINAIRLV